MQKDLKYIRNPKSISGRLEEELVIMDIEKGKYFALNPVATRIWDILENPLTIDQLCEFLMQEYEVSEEQCREEVKEVIGEMVKLGVVVQTE